MHNKYMAFVTAAQLQSFTKAAEVLGYTQSGMSHLIMALEDELDLKLFVRSKNGVQLTREGTRLFPYVKRLLDAQQDVMDIARAMLGVETGQIRVGTFSSIAISCLPQILQGFRQRFPGIQVTVQSGNYAEVEQALADNTVDCGFVSLPSRQGFMVTPLVKDRLIAIVNDKSGLADEKVLNPCMLTSMPFIMPAEGAHYDIGKIFASVGVSPTVRFEMGDDFAAVAMVRHGLGITVLPELMTKSLPQDDKLRFIPLEDSEREIGIAVSSGRQTSPAVRAFVEYVKENIADVIAASGEEK